MDRPNDAQRARVELRRLYAEVADDLARRPALRCGRSGRCCRFREAGHELYVTRLEVEEMITQGGRRAADPERCPWQEGVTCANREGRALACRTYFCSDEALAAEVTERWHGALRAIHERHGLPYDYRPLAAHMNPESPFTSEEVR